MNACVPSKLRGLLALKLCVFGTVGYASDEGFVSLFNGKDLSGWVGLPEFWSVQNGTITGRTTLERPSARHAALVWAGGEVKNFELRLSYRLGNGDEGNDANSGIYYRARMVEPAVWGLRGYQADMNNKGNNITGLLYEHGGRLFMARPGEQVRALSMDGKPKMEVVGVTTDPKVINTSIRPDGWNDYVVIAEGNHLRHYINGLLAVDVIDLDPENAAKRGLLGFQLHARAAMTVQFKDIRLKTLP